MSTRLLSKMGLAAYLIILHIKIHFIFVLDGNQGQVLRTQRIRIQIKFIKARVSKICLNDNL